MLAEKICAAAVRCGYDKCGIIRKERLAGFAELVEKRRCAVPGSAEFYKGMKEKAYLSEYPWAKSVVVCISWYGHYAFPAELKGLYGRTYLADGRIDEKSPEFTRRQQFNRILAEMNIRYATEPKFGLGPVRYAGYRQGLDWFGKITFFCEEKCDLCRRACGTGSLSAPYTMDPRRCVSFLTTFGGVLPDDMEEGQLRTWVHGCDDCQTVCPFNQTAETNELPFPGLDDLVPLLRPENLAELADNTLLNRIQPKLWYIPTDRIEQFRENARRVLRTMRKE